MCKLQNFVHVQSGLYSNHFALEDQLLFPIFLWNNEIDETLKVKGGENVFHETFILLCMERGLQYHACQWANLTEFKFLNSTKLKLCTYYWFQ
jgi:hypothetical protein